MTKFAQVRFVTDTEGHYCDMWIQGEGTVVDFAKQMECLANGYYIGTGLKAIILSVSSVIPMTMEVPSIDLIANTVRKYIKHA